MAKQRIPANRDVLIWARNLRGLTKREAATKLKISEQELTNIEDGESPTTAIFNKMVSVYKQTESTLLLESPPAKKPIPKDYRTAKGRQPKLTPETRLAIRDAQELQSYISELVDDNADLIERVKLPRLTSASNPETAASTERSRLNISLATQLRWSANDSFGNWRDFLGSKGIVVLLKKMPWEDCRGFSLLDHTPVIVVNSEDLPVARIFTLFHEYAHLTLSSAGICSLTADSSVERWCNVFASAFLLPAEELRAYAIQSNPEAGISHDWSMQRLNRLATHYRVSRSVMALRLQKLGLAIPTYYDKHRSELTNFDRRPKSTNIRIKRKPGWKEKQKLKEVGNTAASVIVTAWQKQIADGTEAADILNLSLDELHGLRKQTEVQRVRNVS
jgi:Zn-dependent peptidase ImmA (M78 family)/DNA-binding XRE family transcriptional regulator